jgi:hypothetical protein
MSNATIKSEQLTKADFKVILDVLNVFDTETDRTHRRNEN